MDMSTNYSNEISINAVTTSTLRTKMYRKRFKEENNITEKKAQYSVLSFEDRGQLNTKRKIENLTNYQICLKGESNKKQYKKNKKTSTLDSSYNSSLIIKWDYSNPCEL